MAAVSAVRAARAAIAAGDAAVAAGRHAGAIPFYLKAASLIDRTKAPALFARAHGALAACYQTSRQYAVVARHVKLAASALAEVDPADSSTLADRADCEARLGLIYSIEGRTAEAQCSLENALGKYVLTGDTRGEVTARINLAQVNSIIDPAKAMRSLQQAEALCSSTPDGDSVFEMELININEQKAAMLMTERRFLDALNTLEDAFAQVVRRFGSNSEQAAGLCSRMGAAHSLLRDFASAQDCYSAATSKYERLGMQGTDEFAHVCMAVGTSLLMLHGADDASSADDVMKAKTYIYRALSVFRKILPPDHPSIAHTLGALSMCQARLGNAGAAASAAATASFVHRRSQTQCSGPGCARQLQEDGRAAGRVRQLPPHLLLRKGVPDRGLEGGAQGGVQGTDRGGESGSSGRGERRQWHLKGVMLSVSHTLMYIGVVLILSCWLTPPLINVCRRHLDWPFPPLLRREPANQAHHSLRAVFPSLLPVHSLAVPPPPHHSPHARTGCATPPLSPTTRHRMPTSPVPRVTSPSRLRITPVPVISTTLSGSPPPATPPRSLRRVDGAVDSRAAPSSPSSPPGGGGVSPPPPPSSKPLLLLPPLLRAAAATSSGSATSCASRSFTAPPRKNSASAVRASGSGSQHATTVASPLPPPQVPPPPPLLPLLLRGAERVVMGSVYAA